jgi:hypothetical protein
VLERLPTKRPAAVPATALVTSILEGYAEKAVFRAFSAQPKRAGKAVYKMVWHYDRQFELLLDTPKKTLQFPMVLPGVPPRSQMYRELTAFLKSRQSAEVPEHRRVNPAKTKVQLTNQRGVVALAFHVKDGDFEYATRKIINIVHEIFLGFLVDGSYFEYMVEQLGLDPDRF